MTRLISSVALLLSSAVLAQTAVPAAQRIDANGDSTPDTAVIGTNAHAGMCALWAKQRETNNGLVNNISSALDLIDDLTPSTPASRSLSFRELLPVVDFDNAQTSGSHLPNQRIAWGPGCTTNGGNLSGERLSVRMRGNLHIATAGTYTFLISSDDGYRLNIGGVTIASIDNNRSPATDTRRATFASPGVYPVELIYWDQGGQALLEVFVATSEICFDGSFAQGACAGAFTDRSGVGVPASVPANFTIFGNDRIAPATWAGAADTCASNVGQPNTTCGNTSAASCGNGVVEVLSVGGSEGCDDGNTTAGDGCSATCTVETNYSCGAPQVSVCRPNAPVITAPTARSNLNTLQPVLSGTGVPGATVTARIDGVTACTATVTAGGTWSCTASTQTAGAHTATALQVDTGGRTSPVSSAVSFTLDVTAPAAPLVTAPAPGSSTNDTTPTVSGTAEVGSTVRVFVDGNGAPSCTTTASITGAWSCDVSTALSQGSHSVRATATDAATNTSVLSNANTFTVDSVAPFAPTVTAPVNGSSTNDTTPTISGDAEAGSTVRVFIDGSTTPACTTTATALGTFSCDVAPALAQGPHGVRATATDAVNNTSGLSTPNTFTVDTAAPDTSLTAGPSGFTTATSGAFSFSSSEAGGTFECSLDGSAFATCTSPAAFTGLADGSHTFSVRAIDVAGNVDPTPATRTWLVDTAAPETSIVTAPPVLVNASTAAFTFASNEAGTTFECALDGAAFAACPSNHSLTGLTDGSHTLAVRAVDAAGNRDATPATSTWTVDTTAPDTTLSAAPSGTVFVATASIAFTSTESGSHFECSLDGAAFAACTSAQALSGLSDGAHAFSVRAIDAAGNVDATPATVSWTVDASEPDTTITAGPSGAVSATDATFTFTSSKPGSTFECSVDGAAYSTCTATTAISSLSDGSHTLAVRAVDAGGNVDSTPATRTWTVDTSAPDTTIVSGPPARTNSSTADFTVSSDQAGVTFECSLDGALFTACPAPLSFSSLVDGLHVLLVRAVDAAGNLDATPALATWTVDTVAPGAPLILQPVADATTGALPQFAGLAEPASTVTVIIDNATVCTATTSASGAWSCAASAPLTTGMHVATATATDAAGNVSQPSLPRAFTVGTDAPDTVIASAPSGLVTSTTAAFVFAADVSAAVFECSLDGAAFVACAAAPTFNALAEGAHRLEVRAVSNGVSDPSPAVATWRIDSMAPAAPVITSPAANSTVSSTPAFTGTAEAGSTVVVSLDGAPLCTAVADAAGQFSCTAPSALTSGAHQATARATDAAGNQSPVSTPVDFTVDTSILDTAIIAGPSGTVRSASANFAFVASRLGAGFECSLDGAAFVACSSPTTFTNLSDGTHTLEVRAVDGANVDPMPASRTWAIDATAPTAPVVTAPADQSTVYTRNPRFLGTAEPGSTVRVSVDDQAVCTAVAAIDGTWACTAASPLVSGEHRVSALATDAVGNVSAPSNTNRFTVDLPAIDVVITTPVNGALTADSTPTITGTATPGSTVTVLIDGMAIGTTTADAQGHWMFTPIVALTDGAHVITARAEFMLLVSPVSLGVSVTIDTRAPVVTVTQEQPNTETPPVITFTSDEPGVTYACSVDGAEFKPCSSPFDTTSIGDGNHSLVVRATDAAGNSGESSTTWEVVAPLVSTTGIAIRGGGCGCGATDGSLAVMGLALLTLLSRRRRLN